MRGRNNKIVLKSKNLLEKAFLLGNTMTMPSVKPEPLGINENRKASKPLIEKRRRARINNSLAQLKSMVVGVVSDSQTPNGKRPKLEKADILEMTVSHLKKMNHELMKVPDDERYMAGFTYCLKEVRNYIENNIDDEAKSRVLNYLNGFANKILLTTNHSPTFDLENGIDDSSCSSNSRSETPSSTFTESSPMECHPYSPSPVSQPDSSSTSISSRTSVEAQSLSVNNRLAYLNPDSSVQSTIVPSSKVSLVNESTRFSNRVDALNLTNHNANKNKMSNARERNVFAHSSNSFQFDYSKSGLENRQVYDNREPQRPLMMHIDEQEHLNGCVWRPW